MTAKEYFPWSLQQLAAGMVVAVSSVDALPAEAARDRETYLHYGVKTGLSIPLSTGGGPYVGFLSFNDMKKERVWSEGMVRRLQLVAQIFANALDRKHMDMALRDSEERLSLSADSAGAGLWSLDLASGRYWLTKKARELCDFAADEVVTFDRVMSVIHPDDREQIRQTVQTVVESGKEGSAEYR
jgi:PAS domain-containing protein